jgi:hypothetical protein
VALPTATIAPAETCTRSTSVVRNIEDWVTLSGATVDVERSQRE